MSSRVPSTPPPMEESSSTNPFFTTPQVRTDTTEQSDLDINFQSSHHRGHSFNNHKNRKNDKSSIMLFTPQTPQITRNDDEYSSNLLPLSPQTSTKKSHGIIDVFTRQNNINQQQMLGINHLRTPERTPRHFGRKPNSLDSVYPEDSKKLQHPLFQTAPSTIGSGRSPRTHFRTSSTESDHQRKNILQFRSSIKIQIEEEEEEEEDDDMMDYEAKKEIIRKKEGNMIRKVNFMDLNGYSEDKEKELMNYTSSECESDEENTKKLNLLKRKLSIQYSNFSGDESGNMIEPTTPPRQIMDDEFIYEKLGVERPKFGDFEDIEGVQKDLQNSIKNKRQSNPFLENDSPAAENVKRKKLFDPRFENEIEMIYHVTGEKFFVPLSEEGKKFKPKKLIFDEFKNSENEVTNIDLLQTPPMSRHHKMSIRGLLNESRESGEEREYADSMHIDEGVRYEKIKNPFRGNFARVTSERSSSSSSSSYKDKGSLKKIEYINQTTGERIVEDMDEEQIQIKPRKLNFSGC